MRKRNERKKTRVGHMGVKKDKGDEEGKVKGNMKDWLKKTIRD